MSQSSCFVTEDRLQVSEVAARSVPWFTTISVPALLYIFVSESELNYSGLVAPILIMLSVS